MKKFIIVLMFILPMSGCSVMQVGYLTTEPNLSGLEVNSTSYKQAISMFGQPAMSQISPGREIHSRYFYSTQNAKIDNFKIMKGKYAEGCVGCGSLSLSFEWKETLNNSILVAIGVDNQEMNQKYEEAMSLLMEDKFKEAYSLFAELAINHHTQSQYILGLMYLKGDGVQIDFSKAFELFRTAAIKGHVRAYYDLGAMYRNGEGIEVNIEMAKYCYQKSAEKNYPLAAYELAKLYSEEGAIEKANLWLSKAERLGYQPN